MPWFSGRNAYMVLKLTLQRDVSCALICEQLVRGDEYGQGKGGRTVCEDGPCSPSTATASLVAHPLRCSHYMIEMSERAVTRASTRANAPVRRAKTRRSGGYGARWKCIGPETTPLRAATLRLHRACWNEIQEFRQLRAVSIDAARSYWRIGAGGCRWWSEGKRQRETRRARHVAQESFLTIRASCRAYDTIRSRSLDRSRAGSDA
jgi:hypothetical protein